MNRTLYAAVLAIVSGACWDLAGEGAFSSSHWASTVVLMLIAIATCIDALARVLREDRMARLEAERCRDWRVHAWTDRILEETDALLASPIASAQWREPVPGNISQHDPLACVDPEPACLQHECGRSDVGVPAMPPGAGMANRAVSRAMMSKR